MKQKTVQNLVTQLMILAQLLPKDSTLEPLALAAHEAEDVYETEYTRDLVGDTESDYLDIFFYDSSYISIIAEPENYTLEVSPASTQGYAGERLITINRKN